MSAPHGGIHFMFDGESCRAERLVEPTWLAETLGVWALKLNLTVIGSPRPFVSPDGRTVAAIVLLSESHASVHVEVLPRRVHADVFSCRPFEVATARAFCIEQFSPHRFVDRTLERNLG